MWEQQRNCNLGCASDGKAIGQSGNKEEEHYSVEKKEDSGRGRHE